MREIRKEGYPDHYVSFSLLNPKKSGQFGFSIVKKVSSSSNQAANVYSGKADTEWNKWHHCVACVDTEKNFLNLYFNGVLKQRTPLIDFSLRNDTSDRTYLHFGCDGILIDDVRIYNRKLSEFEVKALYKLGEEN